MEETNPLLSEEDRLSLSNAAPIDSSEWTGGDPNAVSAPLPDAVAEQQLAEESLTSGETATTSTPVQEDTSSSVESPEQGEMVSYGDSMVPAENVEYKTNIFGQKIPFLNKEAAIEANKQDEGLKYLGQPLEETVSQAEQVLQAPGVGLADTAVDVANLALPNPFKLPRPTRFENGAAQTMRDISAFVLPEALGVGVANRLGKAAHAKVGWKIGNQPWMRYLANRGIEAGVLSGISIAKPETKDPGNAFDLIEMGLPGPLKPLVPKTFMTGPASGMNRSPDEIRSVNMMADVGLGFLIPALGHMGKMSVGKAAIQKGVTAADPVTRQLANANSEIKLIANSDSSAGWLDISQPKDRSTRLSQDLYDSRAEEFGLELRWDDLTEEQQIKNVEAFRKAGDIPLTTEGDLAEALVDYSLDQDAALNEFGRYNLSITDDANVSMKGVHDLYDFNEIGMRTVDDFGVVGAAIDQTRIAKNYDTAYGRLRNMVSPAAMKYAGRNLDTVDDITLGLAKDLDMADDLTVKTGSWNIENYDILEAGENLALEFIDPSLDVNGLRRMFGKTIYRNADGVEMLRSGGYGDIFNQINKMGREFHGMTVARAQAYVGTSLAGQISDIAEAARFSRDNTVVVRAAQEKLLDNMKFLMRLKGSTNYYKNMKNTMADMFKTSPATTKQTEKMLIANYPASMKTLDSEIDKFATDMQWAFDNYPELGDSIMELYEITDGRVFDIATINSSLQKSFGNSPLSILKTADSEMPNLIGQAVRANFYNSLFAPIATPAKAFVGNIGGILEEPVSYFAGAVLRGPKGWEDMSKGWYAYKASGAIKDKALPLMGQLFEKAAQNDATVELATDLEFITKTDRKLNSFRELAQTERAAGNEGIAIMVDEYINLQELAQDPTLKFATNSMTGLDGLPQAIVANSEARFRAMEEMDRMKRLGEPINEDLLMKTAAKEYDSMFNENGIIKDKAAKYASDKMALRADSPLYQSFNKLIKEFPFMRLFNPVPGFLANAINVADETLPLPLRSFQKDINDLAYRSMDSFSQNPSLVRDVLENRGYDVNTMDEIAQLGAISRLKNKALGKKAISTVIIGSAATAFGNGRAVGDGLYDKSANETRSKVLDLPREASVKLGDNWVPVRMLFGPGYGQWAATLLTTLDNATFLGSGVVEDIEKKLLFVLGSALEDPTGMGGLRPLFDAFQGNGSSAQRWLGMQVNNRFPAAAARNNLGNIINGGLRLVEGNLAEQILNRNKVFGAAAPAGDLPYYTNPLTGKVPNQYNPYIRLFNTYSPFKITETQTPNQEFLTQIGYSYAGLFKVRDGIKLQNVEREELFTIMGEDQVFNNKVTEIRERAEKSNYLAKLQGARRAGADTENLDEFMNIESELRDAAKLAENIAYERLDAKFKQAINVRKADFQQGQAAAKMGETETFLNSIPTR